MAINLTARELLRNYDSLQNDWKSFKEYESFYIRRIQETRPDTIFYVDRMGKAITYTPINHHPKLMKYEVWMEGYSATGEHEGAVLLGKVEARNFAQACHIIVATAFLQQTQNINDPEFTGWCDPGRWDYDAGGPSIWGRRLFWNEKLARKSFG
jgi:hypothetical protein